MQSNNKQILVGKIVAPQGIRGEVRIQTFTENTSDFKKLAVFGNNVPVGALKFVRAIPNTNVAIAKIEGVLNRNTAETLRGTELFVNREDLPATNNGEYYQADLIGMQVVQDNNVLGRVECFHNFGAGDIMELDNGEMVSFLGAKVDFDNKKIIKD